MDYFGLGGKVFHGAIVIVLVIALYVTFNFSGFASLSSSTITPYLFGLAPLGTYQNLKF